MKISTALLIFSILFVQVVFAQSDKFKYQAAKVDVGSVYHYIKSDKDGSNPEQIAIYVAAADKLEVFKYHPENKGSQSGYVVAWLDYKVFQAYKLESWARVGLNEKKLVATLEIGSKNAVNVTFGDAPPETTEIRYVPFHIYNFDLTSLNFMFRHLVNPQGSFQVGIADPNFAQEGPLFLYRGEATVEYVGDETRDGQACRKYKMDGPGVANRGGFIWVRKSGEFIQSISMDLPDNPNWQSFQFALKSKDKMTPDQWKGFMDAHYAQ